ncbi:15267_t:CDS:2, partial [Dentiscutata heterogama]
MSNKKHTGGKPRHNLTEHILITNEYVNPEKPSDKWCLCRYCDNIGDEIKIVNRWKLQEYNFTKESRKTIKKRKSSELQDEKSYTDIDNAHYIARILTYKEQTQFEKHILNIIVEN